MYRMTANFFFNDAGTFSQFPSDEGELDFFDGALCELLRQRVMGCVVLRDGDAAAGVFIEPMHDARTFFASNSGKIWAMMEQRVYKGVLAMPGPGMNDQPGRFVNHNQIVVLKKNVERNGLWLIVDLLRRWLS